MGNRLLKTIAWIMMVSLLCTLLPVNILCENKFLEEAGEEAAILQSKTEYVDGNFKYTLNNDGTTATITGYNAEPSGSLNIPDSVGGYKVTGIGEKAFYGCDGFTGELSIPESVTRINAGAFWGCSGLSGSIILPDGIKMVASNVFENCSGFDGELVIPDSVTDIGIASFYGCSNLSGQLKIPDNVTSIGNQAFDGCAGFTGNLVIPDSVTSLGLGVFRSCSGFDGELTISKSITSIERLTFYGCSGLTGKLVLPDGLTTIGDNAFHGCAGFTGGLIIPDKVTCIEQDAFRGCSNFSGDLIIPDSVTSIGPSAFEDCSGFTGKLVLSDGLTSIEEDAFKQCAFTGRLVIPNSVKNIGSRAFLGCKGFTGNLIIPDSVTSIGYSAFYDCSGFNGKLRISKNMTALEDHTFNACTGLTGRLIIPDCIKTIGVRVFEDCGGFTGSLTIPDSVESIGWYAFYGCSGLSGSLVIGKNLASVDYDSFPNCEIKRVVNNSETEIDLTEISYAKIWRDASNDDKITRIKKGTALREDYEHDEPDDEDDFEDDYNYDYDYVTVSFNNCGNTIIPSQKIRYGKTAEKPEDPYKQSFEFTGWFKDEVYTVPFDFSTPVFEDTALYARWEQIPVRSEINGRGYAQYMFTLTDDNDNALPNTMFNFQYFDDEGVPISSKLPDISLNDGRAWIITPTFDNTNVLGTPLTKKIVCKIFSNNEEFKTKTLPFEITVNPLSFSQEWTVRNSRKVEFLVGEGVGVKAGVAKAKASLAEAAINGTEGTTLSVIHTYDKGKRKLKLCQEGNIAVGLNVEAKPNVEAGAVGNSAEIRAFKIEGAASVGKMFKAGRDFTDYDPNSDKQKKEIALFMLGACALGEGNVMALNLCDSLGYDYVNILGNSTVFSINAGADVGAVEAKAEGISVLEGEIIGADFNSTFSYGEEMDTDGVAHVMKKQSVIDGGLINYELPTKGVDGTLLPMIEKNPVDYSIRAYSHNVNRKDDKFIIDNQISIKPTNAMSNKSDVISERVEFVYDTDKLWILYRDLPEFKKFADGKSRYFLDSAFKNIMKDKLSKVTTEAVFNNNRYNTDVSNNLKLELEAELEVGVGGAAEYVGISENSYTVQSGTYKNGVYTINAVNNIDDLVENNLINDSVMNFIINPVGTMKNMVKDVINDAAEKLKDGFNDIKEEACNLIGENLKLAGKEIWAHIISIYDKNNNSSVSSYTITAYNSKNTGNLNSAGEELKTTALTVGKPYYVYLSDKNGDKINDFSDIPLKLVLSYSDAMLSDINASSADEKNIEIFKYMEDKCGYESVGGDVDEENNKVSITITEPGQFLLAINTNLLPADENGDGNIGTASGNILDKMSSRTYEIGSDVYTVSWNSYAVFDGRNHYGAGIAADGTADASKTSPAKAFDVKFLVTKNGEVLDPSLYKLKAKNSKNATVSADGITVIRAVSNKHPLLKIKFKGKDYKGVNNVLKNEIFEFDIIQAELKQDNVTFDKVKTGKDGSFQIKKLTYNPVADAGGVVPKPQKLKNKKNADKTDYVTDTKPDGSIIVTGCNNYYGSVVYKP